MNYNKQINELIMWLFFFIFVGWLFFGCSTDRELALRYENQRITLTAIKILMEKNKEVDSLNTELDNCKNNSLRVKR